VSTTIATQVKCYVGVGHEREEVARIKIGGYFGETALLHDLPTKVCEAKIIFSGV